ncbi:MBL fold metallo-hydrolase [Schauerella aestuarii]|uniref:MBL fold metallo-hydrolase n=1 Tax=Schauerella aestuarii TaxID=2511204 RepID=UPI002E2BA8F8|nr:MBL fold metallo-hydrolase [Achromobacter aestuarii]
MNLFHASNHSSAATLSHLSSRLAAVSLVAFALGASLPSSATAHESVHRTPLAKSAQHQEQSAFYRFEVGDVRVVALSDGTVPQDLHSLLKGVSPAEIDTILHRAFMANPVEASINAYLIEGDGRVALVDTGAGAFFGPGAGGKLLASLRSAGYGPEHITDVLLTHIHTDHSGGLVDAQGGMVFRNATIHVGQQDVDFFLAAANQKGVDGYDKAYFEQATKSMQPYVKAGRVKGFSSVTEVMPGVKAVPTPGHTPGHAFFVLSSKGQSLEFIGDVLHVQSVQMARPEITIVYDVEQPAARSQRETQFARLAHDRHMIAGAHLPFPGIGHIRKESTGFTYVPTDYRNRAVSN